LKNPLGPCRRSRRLLAWVLSQRFYSGVWCGVLYQELSQFDSSEPMWPKAPPLPLELKGLMRIYVYSYVSHVHSRGTPGVFYTNFYNHAHRPRLEKLLYLELSRSPNGFFKALLDPGGGLTSETAARRFQN
jgi:hypothetical protein